MMKPSMDQPPAFCPAWELFLVSAFQAIPPETIVGASVGTESLRAGRFYAHVVHDLGLHLL